MGRYDYYTPHSAFPAALSVCLDARSQGYGRVEWALGLGLVGKQIDSLWLKVERNIYFCC